MRFISGFTSASTAIAQVKEERDAFYLPSFDRLAPPKP